jgi:hypothetical protein
LGCSDVGASGVWAGTAGATALVAGGGVCSGVGLGSTTTGIGLIVVTILWVHTAGLALPVAANAVRARIPVMPEASPTRANRSVRVARGEAVA